MSNIHAASNTSVSPPSDRTGTSQLRSNQLRSQYLSASGRWCGSKQSDALCGNDVFDGLLQRIYAGFSIHRVVTETVYDLRQVLDVDRAIFYRFGSLADSTDSPPHLVLDGSQYPMSLEASGVCIEAEAVSERSDKLSETSLLLPWNLALLPPVPYLTGQAETIPSVAQVMLPKEQLEWLQKWRISASLSVPIISSQQQLQGILAVHYCQGDRHWSPEEVTLLQRLAMQLALAIEQEDLRRDVYRLNVQLEASNTDRTTSLKQSLKFAELVLHVTERIRDSLDEGQILQTSTQELAKALNVERCNIELYDADATIATVAYEHAVHPPNRMGSSRHIDHFPELYHPLRQHQPVQFVVPYDSDLPLGDLARLACPIFDDQGDLGNLWLFRPRRESFNRWEIRIVQQIANECAIAIRQARLYEAAQQQVRELERLNQLKDDFLKTISHELRSPLSSIILGAQTLEKVLNQAFESSFKSTDERTIRRLFQTLHTECHRENKLIEDLLTFCYLEAGSEALLPTTIDLNQWIGENLEPFQLRIQNQQQQLTVSLDPNLPPLDTESAYLERIFSELLNNACKYTPSGECIAVSTEWTSVTDPSSLAVASGTAAPGRIILRVQNSGIEIPPEEHDRIFDKFYRIPSSDPWKYGGTGLGLALVKRLTECLGASVDVESVDGQTIFSVIFPVATAPVT